jgi:hypothetical protein
VLPNTPVDIVTGLLTWLAVGTRTVGALEPAELLEQALTPSPAMTSSVTVAAGRTSTHIYRPDVTTAEVVAGVTIRWSCP